MLNSINRDGREVYVSDDDEPCEVDITDWSEADKVAYREEVALLNAEEELSKKTAEEFKAHRSSPSEELAKTRALRELKKELRESFQQCIEDDKTWRTIQKEFGKGRVFRFDTKGGMVCARVPSGEEALRQHLSMAGLALPDRVDSVREYIVGLVVHPSKEEVEKIGEQWPGLWGDLEGGVQALQSARVGEQGPFV